MPIDKQCANKMKISSKIIALLLMGMLACTGTKKYFKAAEKLEKQGLVNEAAEFYLESLQRKPTNVDARIKLKEVGQKYVSFMSSEFFRSYNTGQMDGAIEDFEKLKNFTGRTEALNVTLNYPTAYEEDYKKAIEKYCEKNYNQGAELVKQKKYTEALTYLNNVNKYKPEYKKNKQLKIIATCEPMYQNAIIMIQGKNYVMAYRSLQNIHGVTDSYKDSKELDELCASQQAKSLLMFQPKAPQNATLVDYLFNNFSQAAGTNFKHIEVINNSPFVYLPGNDIEGNVDLIQGIRKASGADFFYVFDVMNKKSQMVGPTKANSKCYLKTTYKKNDTTIITEYKATDYFQVKTKRVYSYDFKYKLVNALNNQIVSFQTITINKFDEVEYNEFTYAPKGNLDDYWPYNPQATAPLAQYNPKNWRKLFTANKNVKTEQELETAANQEAIKIFSQTLTNYVK
jgi:hypothetical protein